MTRRRYRVAALAVAASVVAAGCGVQSDARPRALDPSTVPLRNLGQTPTPAPSGATRVVVYLVQDGSLVGVVRRVPSQQFVAAVLSALTAGPSAQERDAGLTTSVPAGTALDGAALRAGIAYVEVPAGVAADTGRNDEVLAYGQVVLTLCGLAPVKAVQFVRDGHPLAVPRADGSLTPQPLSRRDYALLL